MSGSPVPVSDLLSNLNDQLAAAARIIGRSKHRQAIFAAVYRGPKQLKTIRYIAQEIGISEVHVLKEGGKMAGLLLEKVRGGYKKKKEFATRYKTILAMAKDKRKLRRLPTKVSPRISATTLRVAISFPSSAQNAKFVTVDQIRSFSKVTNQLNNGVPRLAEKKIKKGFARIIGERGSFKDWGGEKSDLYSTRVRVGNKRLRAAIAFKGKATSGKLVPKKMGKNGDQINRLFDEPAELFLVVYGGQIDSSIISQMQAFAMGQAMSGRKIYYGVIDGADLGRILAAYPKYFS
jgi:hypothetical protein